jgi:hypothetical protein
MAAAAPLEAVRPAGLQPQAEQARDQLAAHLAKTEPLANRFQA